MKDLIDLIKIATEIDEAGYLKIADHLDNAIHNFIYKKAYAGINFYDKMEDLLGDDYDKYDYNRKITFSGKTAYYFLKDFDRDFDNDVVIAITLGDSGGKIVPLNKMVITDSNVISEIKKYSRTPTPEILALQGLEPEENVFEPTQNRQFTRNSPNFDPCQEAYEKVRAKYENTIKNSLAEAEEPSKGRDSGLSPAALLGDPVSGDIGKLWYYKGIAEYTPETFISDINESINQKLEISGGDEQAFSPEELRQMMEEGDELNAWVLANLGNAAGGLLDIGGAAIGVPVEAVKILLERAEIMKDFTRAAYVLVDENKDSVLYVIDDKNNCFNSGPMVVPSGDRVMPRDLVAAILNIHTYNGVGGKDVIKYLENEGFIKKIKTIQNYTEHKKESAAAKLSKKKRKLEVTADGNSISVSGTGTLSDPFSFEYHKKNDGTWEELKLSIPVAQEAGHTIAIEDDGGNFTINGDEITNARQTNPGYYEIKIKESDSEGNLKGTYYAKITVSMTERVRPQTPTIGGVAQETTPTAQKTIEIGYASDPVTGNPSFYKKSKTDDALHTYETDKTVYAKVSDGSTSNFYNITPLIEAYTAAIYVKQDSRIPQNKEEELINRGYKLNPKDRLIQIRNLNGSEGLYEKVDEVNLVSSIKKNTTQSLDNLVYDLAKEALVEERNMVSHLNYASQSTDLFNNVYNAMISGQQ
jgi:hypothetical protein